jgi:hypothetical protein
MRASMIRASRYRAAAAVRASSIAAPDDGIAIANKDVEIATVSRSSTAVKPGAAEG